MKGHFSPVKDLLQNVQNLVCGPVLAVPLVQVVTDGSLTDHALAVGRGLNNGLSTHAATLGRKVNALSGALGDVPSGVSNKSNAALAALGPGVLRDGVRLDTDDLSTLSPRRGTVARRLLVLLDSSLVDNGSGADGHVVVLGEHPSVEVRGDIVTDVHLSKVLVVLHLVIGDTDALLLYIRAGEYG